MVDIFSNPAPLIALILRKAIPCPECFGFNLRRMPYGMGTIGGCVVSTSSPKILCNLCGHSFLNDREIMEIYEKIMEAPHDLTDEYLMEEILLADDQEVSRYMKMVAIAHLEEEKSLLELRLMGDIELQKWVKSRAIEIRNQST